MSTENSKEPDNNDYFGNSLLSYLSLQILQVLSLEKMGALQEMRAKLIESPTESDLKLDELPNELKLKLRKCCETVALESDIYKINQSIKIFYDLMDVIYSKSYYETQNEIEARLAKSIRARLSSLPYDEIVPSYDLDPNAITQDSASDWQIKSLADSFFIDSMAQSELNGKYDLMRVISNEVKTLSEKEESATKLKVLESYPTTMLQEFQPTGDQELQNKLVEEVQADIKKIILFIGAEDIKNWRYDELVHLTDDEIETQISNQAEGRRKAESAEYRIDKTDKEIESLEEWLIGARSREARMREIIIYRQEKKVQILELMSKVKDDLENQPNGSDKTPKLTAEYLYLQDLLLNVEKLFNTEYGHYLWRKQHHEQFLKDQIKSLWLARNENQDDKTKIKNLIRETKQTREYGYDYQNDNSKRPRGL